MSPLYIVVVVGCYDLKASLDLEADPNEPADGARRRHFLSNRFAHRIDSQGSK